MSHIFISYSKKNQDYARLLVNQLLDKGFDIWVDDRSLRSSEDWWRSIVVALRTCNAMIVIVTPEFDASDWVQREVTLALKYKKSIFPLWLSGSMDTPNWEVFVRTQYIDVRDNSVPAEEFYDSLAQHTPRKKERGKNVTATGKIDPVTLDDDELIKDIANPPPLDITDLRLVKAKPRMRWLEILIGLLVIAALGSTALFMSNSLRPPSPTITPSASPTFTNPAPIGITPTLQFSLMDELNGWRESNGYQALTVNPILNEVATLHLSDLRSRPLSELGNTYRNRDGDDAQTMAGQAEYNGEVQMFVEVTQGDFSIDDLVLELETRGGSDVHSQYTEYGFDLVQAIATEYLYVVLILGRPQSD